MFCFLQIWHISEGVRQILFRICKCLTIIVRINCVTLHYSGLVVLSYPCYSHIFYSVFVPERTTTLKSHIYQLLTAVKRWHMVFFVRLFFSLAKRNMGVYQERTLSSSVFTFLSVLIFMCDDTFFSIIVISWPESRRSWTPVFVSREFTAQSKERMQQKQFPKT